MTFYLDSIKTAISELEDGRELDNEIKNLLDKINNQIWDAVRATEDPIYEYQISLVCVFDGKTPEEALGMFISWMNEDPYNYVYRVEGLDNNENVLLEGNDAAF